MHVLFVFFRGGEGGEGKLYNRDVLPVSYCVNEQQGKYIFHDEESPRIGAQSRFGDESHGSRVDCPQIGTAVLKGLSRYS